MKKNQMEVMRIARNAALAVGVQFYTINLKNELHKKGNGSITVAYRTLSIEDGVDHVVLYFVKLNNMRVFRVQFSFCSPNEKNPSCIFGEGQASLRWGNPKSALFLNITTEHTFTEALRLAALEVANMHEISWLMDKNIGDLV